jgi:hypothetical protein
MGDLEPVAEPEPEPEPDLEWKLRASAIPAALALAIAFHAWPLGHWLQRTFLSMMVHEVGHAVTAWLCGFAAIPTLWKTLIPEARSTLVTLVVLAIWVVLIARGWQTRRIHLAYIGIAIAIAQYLGRVSTSAVSAHEAITFGGDAGGMVLGACLMATFFARPTSQLRTNHLRWGFLVIGAAALVDTLGTWWQARSNPDVIPFGEIEGVGLSDPSKLQDVYGWTTDQLVHRYVVAGYVSLAALAVTWGFAVHHARARRAAPCTNQ